MSSFTLSLEQEWWLNELETTSKEQGRGSLCENGKYCCLGVYAESRTPLKETMIISKYGKTTFYGCASYLPPRLAEKLGLGDGRGHSFGSKPVPSLVSLNDFLKLSFKEIALVVRAHPTAYFKEPK